MFNILVANPKGGSGKTTLATNLAGYFAKLGGTVVLRDLDRQQSATRWIERRPV
jgi:chromosome partitioning protein